MGLFVLYLFVCLFFCDSCYVFEPFASWYSRLKRLDLTVESEWIVISSVDSAIQRVPEELDPKGAFHSAYNSGSVSRKSNGTDPFGSIRPEYLRLPLKVVHFDWSTHYRILSLSTWQSRCPQYRSSVSCLQEQKTWPNASGLGQVSATGLHLSIGHVGFPKFQTGLFVECKGPRKSSSSELRSVLAEQTAVHMKSHISAFQVFLSLIK